MRKLKLIKNVVCIVVICSTLVFWWYVSLNYVNSTQFQERMLGHIPDIHIALKNVIMYFLYWLIVSLVSLGTILLMFNIIKGNSIAVRNNIKNTDRNLPGDRKASQEILKKVKDGFCVFAICVWSLFMWFFVLITANQIVYQGGFNSLDVGLTDFALLRSILITVHGIVILVTALVTIWLMLRFIKEK